MDLNFFNPKLTRLNYTADIACYSNFKAIALFEINDFLRKNSDDPLFKPL